MSWKRWLLTMQMIIIGMTTLCGLGFFSAMKLMEIHGEERGMLIAGAFVACTLFSFGAFFYHMGKDEGFTMTRNLARALGDLLKDAREEILNPIDGHDGAMLKMDVVDRIDKFIGK